MCKINKHKKALNILGIFIILLIASPYILGWFIPELKKYLLLLQSLIICTFLLYPFYFEKVRIILYRSDNDFLLEVASHDDLFQMQSRKHKILSILAASMFLFTGLIQFVYT
ncbi:hypothetical protein MNBD_GAMMA05-2304 [hydrothermal vent metagenome]|uniref:Uncharacterized protein n=1 Tax=hydrothermal vent metagenome TaxID=652676 RepID=A0A3B0WET6_9ZZZZ